MAKIIRTKIRAEGGITPEEKVMMAVHTKKWIDVAMRTDPIEPDKIIPAIEGLYAAAGLKKPRVVIVPSPLVMAFSYGAATWIWHCRKTDEATIAATDVATIVATIAATTSATDEATRKATSAATDAATRKAISAATDASTRKATSAATYEATRKATIAATIAATDLATYDATREATYAATRGATEVATSAATDEATAKSACFKLAGNGGIDCANRWWNVYQGGNMWAGWCAYLSAGRDILKLELPEYEKFKFYEDAAIHGGFRVMHEEFCIVSDFPEVINKDEQNRPHCETGASHKWRDGWELFHWHGVKVPKEWIVDKSLTAKEALSQTNTELRRAACEILGWAKILKELNAKVIDKEDDELLGELIEVNLPDHGKQRFLRVRCGTGREFAMRTSNKFTTVLEAQAAMRKQSVGEFKIPALRT